ncbi:MAG: DNA-protecting protein DprA [Tissierellia bacterium]|nr:DNA-protecting protein DprA [Tissierellia bacterium]
MKIYRKDFPLRLQNIEEVPEFLYYIGDRSLLNKKTVTIVGTRRPTARGRHQTRKIVEKLISRDIVVVSGFAKGIDEEAHRAALELGGTTIAVLGAGLDSTYPRGRDWLRRETEKRGLILSEYERDQEPRPWHFPKRNRLLSGLSPITIVVEATIESGTMITARQALSQNRNLWVVPGPPESEMSLGPNYLIFQGANPLYHYDLIDHWEEDIWQRIW